VERELCGGKGEQHVVVAVTVEAMVPSLCIRV